MKALETLKKKQAKSTEKTHVNIVKDNNDETWKHEELFFYLKMRKRRAAMRFPVAAMASGTLLLPFFILNFASFFIFLFSCFIWIVFVILAHFFFHLFFLAWLGVRGKALGASVVREFVLFLCWIVVVWHEGRLCFLVVPFLVRGEPISAQALVRSKV